MQEMFEVLEECEGFYLFEDAKEYASLVSPVDLDNLPLKKLGQHGIVTVLDNGAGNPCVVFCKPYFIVGKAC